MPLRGNRFTWRSKCCATLGPKLLQGNCSLFTRQIITVLGSTEWFIIKKMAGSTVLCKTQLQKLKEHKYSAQGSSLSEKIFQPYWRYVVELMPLWLAPNTITSLGLALNFITSVAVIYLCPLAKGDVSLRFLCQHCFQLFGRFGLFVNCHLKQHDIECH